MAHRVLVVDDNAPLAENLCELLEDQGYEVATATGAEQAMEVARRWRFDVALIDVTMPGRDGIALKEDLARMQPSAKFLLMSAFTDQDQDAEAVASGVTAVLPKPLPLEELFALLPVPNERRPAILLLEDDLDFAALVTTVLSRRGYLVHHAATLAVARRLMDTESVEAMVVDVELPDGKGTDFAREATRDRVVPVVVMTGRAMEEARSAVEGDLRQASRLLQKPFQTQSLLDALAALGHGTESPR